MSQLFNSIINVTKPTAFAVDAGLSVKSTNNKIYTKCPCSNCNGKLYITEDEFVCSNKSCSFRAGGVLDYLAIGKPNYDSAVKRLYGLYENAIKQTLVRPWEKTKGPLARWLEQRRMVYDWLMKLRFRGDTSSARLSLHGLVSDAAWEFNPDTHKTSLFFANQRHMEDLRNRLCFLGEDLNIPADKDMVFMVAPYFGNYHTISHLRIIWAGPNGNPEFLKIPINPCRFSYFGLLDASLFPDTMSCSVDTLTACGVNSWNFNYNRYDFCFGINTDLQADTYYYLPKKIKYMYQILETVPHMKALEEEGVEVVVTDDKTSDLNWEMPFNEFVCRKTIDTISKLRQITPDLRFLLTAAQPSHESKLRIINSLRDNDLYHLIEDFEKVFETERCVQLGNYKLFTTVDGYEIQKGRQPRECVTNFTIEFTHNLNFPDSSERYALGETKFMGDSYPIVVSHLDLQKPQQLEHKVFAAIQRSKPEGTEINGTPKLLSSSYNKYFKDMFSLNTANLPNAQGIPYLGWSPQRDKFYGPSWVTNAKGTKHSEGVLHPGVKALDYFNGRSLCEGKFTDNLPAALCDLISIAVAYAARCYLNYPVSPIHFTNNPGNRNTLSAIFRGLGQEQPILFQPNERATKDMEGLNGFSAYGVNLTNSKSLSSKLPVFMLTEKGSSIPSVEDSDLVKAASAIKHILIKACEWIHSTQGKECKKLQKVLYKAELIQEGEYIIQQCLGIASWPSSEIEHEALEEFLASKSITEITEYFGHDFEKQTLVFHGDKLKEALLDTVLNDLKDLCSKVEVVGKKVLLDSLSGMRLLNNFYGEPPSIPHILTAELEEKEAQENPRPQAAQKESQAN